MARSLPLLLALACACAPTSEGSPDVEPGESAAPKVVVERDPDAPAQAPAPEPEPAVFEPATRGDGGCIVTVEALLEAEEYRGSGPITPALEASLAADPDAGQMWASEGHGDHHIQCHYEVTLEHLPGQRFRWRTIHSNTLRDKTTEICKAEVAAVAEDIVRTTQGCQDFAAGAYWGYVLEAF